MEIWTNNDIIAQLLWKIHLVCVTHLPPQPQSVGCGDIEATTKINTLGLFYWK